jgi:hypothetical protein
MERIISALGKEIKAVITRLDEGINILIIGGDRTHIGAVSIAEKDGTVQTVRRADHKEFLISEKWASKLAVALNCPVCMECGIHYDNIAKEEIDVVTGCCEKLLREVLWYQM